MSPFLLLLLSQPFFLLLLISLPSLSPSHPHIFTVRLTFGKRLSLQIATASLVSFYVSFRRQYFWQAEF